VNDPNRVVVRVRKRTRRHRRNRLIRRGVLAAAFVIGGLAGAALFPFDFSSYLSSSFSAHPASEWTSRGDVHRDLALSAADSDASAAPDRKGRPVYPYSLVPGGVHDPKELERAVERDPVLASHYRDFDFRRARVEELTQDRTMYVSYRIGGPVYWTTKRVRLHRGEKVLTDGKTTVRTRCANQVSETAREEVSPHEPAIAKMEQPIREGGRTQVIPIPAAFDSGLARPNFRSFGPTEGYGLITNNGGTLSLFPPPLPSCGPNHTKGKHEAVGDVPVVVGHAGKKKDPAGCNSTPPPTAVPEPGTLLLLSTGIAVAYLRYRKTALG
jgi:PEP-CTERM motif